MAATVADEVRYGLSGDTAEVTGRLRRHRLEHMADQNPWVWDEKNGV